MTKSKEFVEGTGEGCAEGRVYVDLDDVLCETMRGFLEVLAGTLGKRVAYRDVFSFDLQRSFALTTEDAARFFEACHTPDVLAQLLPTARAADVLANWRRSGLRVTIVTGRPPSTQSVTRDWLEANRMAYSELLFVDKYGRHPGALPLSSLPVERFKFAIEDNADVALDLARRDRPVVALLSRPWNRSGSFTRSGAGRIVRCRTWVDIAQLWARLCE